MMTRFEKEISGMLGEYWLNSAKKELEEVQKEFNKGEITVDANGVLRNRIGRVAVKEVCEKCKYIGIVFDEEETKRAREYATREVIEQYKAQQRNHKPTEEELYEMKAAFGEGTIVVDVITGRKIRL